MSSAGRKRDPVWNFFTENPRDPGKTGSRVKCKTCSKEIQGIVERMKKHIEQCHRQTASDCDLDVDGIQVVQCLNEDNTASSSQAGPSSSTSGSTSAEKRKLPISLTSAAHQIEPASKRVSLATPGTPTSGMKMFVVKTTKSQKEKLDCHVAKFVYATNSPFRIVEHKQFLEMTKSLRPGYTPPSRVDVAGKLLDQVYEVEQTKCSEMLQDKYVSMSLDGWSNIHNEPVICVSVTTSEGNTYLTDTIDASGSSETGEYLTEVASNAIRKCEKMFKCKVKSLVTDNAKNMEKMRKELSKGNGDVITYGCSAHLLHLLAKDLQITDVKEHIVEIAKYFRNNHFAAATYKSAGGSKIPLPQDVRWNTMVDCLQAYIDNWPIIMTICEQHRVKINGDVSKKVLNLSLKRNGEDLLRRLKPIAVALDRTQRDKCCIADAVHEWKELQKSLIAMKLPCDKMTCLKKRMKLALTSAHLLANVLHPKYQGKDLSDDELNDAMNFANETFPRIIPMLIAFRVQGKPFQQFMFKDDTIQSVEPTDWWKSQCKLFSSGNEVLGVVMQLLTAVASSAGVERIFSSFGIVHSKLRNHLGIEKAAKLVFLFKLLNGTGEGDMDTE